MKNAMFMNHIMEKVDKIAQPMNRFSKIPFIKAITNGMVAAIGVTMIGSIFLIFYLLCSDGNLTETALLPFLKPFADEISLVNSLSMNIMAVYMVISIGSEYAEIKGINKTTGAVGSFFAFILLNYASIGQLFVEGVEATALPSAVPINYWGGAGVITALVACAISIQVIQLCYHYHIRIALPDSVPPAIADSFSAIIPYLFITLICWGVRTIMNMNLPELVGEMLLPVLSGADNIFVFSFAHFLATLFWAAGLNGDNIVNAVITPFTTSWIIENNEAFLSGQAIPHVWVPSFNRLFFWVSTCWPVLFYMYKSQNQLPHLKTLATVCLPSSIFCIVEPVMYGLPIVLNSFLVIPFVLSHTITGVLAYALTDMGIIGKMYLNLPWATPSPILGYLATGGSIMAVVIVFVNFMIGIVIFYPFWKAYEKSEVERIQSQENI